MPTDVIKLMCHSVKAKAFAYLKMTMQGNSRKETAPSLHTTAFYSIHAGHLLDLNRTTHSVMAYICHTDRKPGPKTPNNVNPREFLWKKMFQGPGKEAQALSFLYHQTWHLLFFDYFKHFRELMPSVSQELLPLSLIVFLVAVYKFGNTTDQSRFSIVWEQ